MFENLLGEALMEYYIEEFSLHSPAEEHKFSLKHRLAMRKIFKRYERNTKQLRPKAVQSSVPDFSQRKFRLTPKRLLVLAIIILLATLAGCSVSYFISQNFRSEAHNDNTELFPMNLENCPTTIEEKYFLSEIPEGFEVLQTGSNPFSEYIGYINKQTGQTISFSQYVKSEFTFNYNTEKGELIEIEINGHYGLFLNIIDKENIASGVIWDNGDYIFKVSGNLDKNGLLNLAKSAKVSET